MYPQICRFFIEKSMSCSTELVSTHKRHSVHILATCDLKEQSLELDYFSFHADDLNMHFMIGFVHSYPMSKVTGCDKLTIKTCLEAMG